MVGIGTAEEDASNPLLPVHFHEVGIYKGWGLLCCLGSRRRLLLECGTGGVVPIFIVMGFDGFDGLLLRIRSSMINLASFIHS